jgi:hypothetical protein
MAQQLQTVKGKWPSGPQGPVLTSRSLQAASAHQLPIFQSLFPKKLFAEKAEAGTTTTTKPRDEPARLQSGSGGGQQPTPLPLHRPRSWPWPPPPGCSGRPAPPRTSGSPRSPGPSPPVRICLVYLVVATLFLSRAAGPGITGA